MEKNYGIRASGDAKITAGAMAAGDHPTAINLAATASLTDARAEMAHLLDLLRAEPEPPGQAIELAELADHELGKKEPDKRSVLRLLELIASGAKSIASIGSAVTAVQQAVGAIL